MIEKNINTDDFLEYHKNEFKLFAQTDKGKKYYDEYHHLDSGLHFVPVNIDTTTTTSFPNLNEQKAGNFYEYENDKEDKKSHENPIASINEEFSMLYYNHPFKVRYNKENDLTNDIYEDEDTTFKKEKNKIIRLRYTANVKKNIQRFLSGISFFLANKIKQQCSRFVHFIEEIEWFTDKINKELTFLRLFIYPEKKENRLFFIETIITIEPCYTTTTTPSNNNNNNNNKLNNDNRKMMMIENKEENIEFSFETKFYWDKEYNNDSQKSKNTFHHSSFLFSLFKMTYSEKKMSQYFEEELKVIFSDFCEYIRQQKNQQDNQKEINNDE